ncbi:hypothetical protein [Methanobrevibacter sp.]|uniref:hypothetical protein n=1 Tax=Methanobrevibacter sp. TaxID=66852 RepID=UPI0038677BF4
MSFFKEISNAFSKIETKYDLVAFCYYYLEKSVGNQIIFLGEYIEINNSAEMINPNLMELNSMALKIKKILKKDPFKPFLLNNKSNQILDLIEDTEKNLKDFGDVSLNNSTIPFFILQGLELYFQDCAYETFENSPLNSYLNELYLIYVNGNISIMDDIIIDKKYSEKINRNEIRNYFKHIIILKNSEIPENYGKPKLITLHKEEKSFENIVTSKKIKIALIPVIKEKWFEFSNKMGASFVIEYDEQKMNSIKNKVIALLDWAIECKVNIIVFPEYVCNEDIQSTICEYLSNMSLKEPKKLTELLFVIAGSGWTKDSNNVSCLYSYDGILLGKVYKYSAYDNDKNGERYIERLQNPGKEITLVKIPRIGVFQTEICRNVSENEFSLKLSKVFNSQFLLITAWSSSINIGFKKQIDSIISSNHKTCSAMCNCCAAIWDENGFREEIGIIAAPQKNKSLIEANYEYIKRNKQECDMSCEKGCIFEICYDFNGKGKRDVMITSNFRKKLK